MKAKRLILIICLSGFVLAGMAQAGGTAFIYRVKITDVTNAATFEAVSSELKTLFDDRVLFNDTTDEIIIHSDMDVSEQKLVEKLNVAGYLLKSYRQVALPRQHN